MHNMKLVFKVSNGKIVTRAPATPAIHTALAVDNHVTPVTSDYASSAVDDYSDLQDKKERRRRQRKKNKERQRNNKLWANLTPPQGSELASGDYDNAKWRQKEPGYVEKVNNLMKQEASIGGINAGARPGILSGIQILLLILFGWVVVQL